MRKFTRRQIAEKLNIPYGKIKTLIRDRLQRNFKRIMGC
jgi:DNA-directed RNA polymerase specialized sigma24 family protein